MKYYIQDQVSGEYWKDRYCGTTTHKGKATIYDEKYIKEQELDKLGEVELIPILEVGTATVEQMEKPHKTTVYKGEFSNILSSMNDLLEYKNTRYGDAVLNPLEIFCGKCKAGQRLDDKLGRIKNSKELRKNDVADLIGYLVLTCKEKGWDNFDEFKD